MNSALFICQNIAEKLSNPEHVQSSVENIANKIDRPNSYWQSDSFADGFAGIAYFFSAMDQAFPQDNWNRVAQDHIMQALRCFKEHKSVNSSLFKGLAGLSLAMTTLQNDSKKFQEFHKGIDDWLIEDVTQKFLMQIPRFLDKHILISPFFYTFPSGLSGILSYLIFRKDHPYLQALAQKCADDLAKLMLTKKRVGSKEVHAWYFGEDQLHEAYRTPDSEGGYNTSMVYGITGCLLAFSLALLEGVRLDSVYEAVESIAFWLKDIYQYVLAEGNWSWTFSVEGEAQPFASKYHGFQNTWLYGWPPVIKSLFFAGKALKSESLVQFAKILCAECIARGSIFFLNGSSFCLGAAGFLSTLFPIAREMNDPNLIASLKEIKRECLNLYDANETFGFAQYAMGSDEIAFPIESPSLVSGAAGIGLTLLTVEERFVNQFIHLM